MSLKSIFIAGTIALFPALTQAQMIVDDAYARAASPVAISGAAFMAVANQSDTDDRVVAARSAAAERVELHTHIQTDNGIMRMLHVEEGIEIPAGETIVLERGGMHVMLLGLTNPLLHGDQIEITLEFEHADPVTVAIPVDLERQPSDGGMQMDDGADG